MVEEGRGTVWGRGVRGRVAGTPGWQCDCIAVSPFTHITLQAGGRSTKGGGVHWVEC